MGKKTLITSGARKVHYRYPNVENRKLALACGRLYTPYMIGEGGGADASEDIRKVTCKKCLAVLRKYKPKRFKPRL